MRAWTREKAKCQTFILHCDTRVLVRLTTVATWFMWNMLEERSNCKSRTGGVVDRAILSIRGGTPITHRPKRAVAREMRDETSRTPRVPTGTLCLA